MAKRNVGEKTKSDILEAAIALTAERGSTEAVSLRDIAKKLGVYSSRITYHFSSRKQLFDEMEARVSAARRVSNPIPAYLDNKRDMLKSKEGQINFLSGLVPVFCEYFKNISNRTWEYSMVYRDLLRTKSPNEAKKMAALNYFGVDALAFHEIYRIITGDDDIENSYSIFISIFVPLALCFSGRLNVRRFSEKYELGECYGERLSYYAIKRLLIELGLTEGERFLENKPVPKKKR